MSQTLPSGSLSGKTALVTGSSRGIGADTVRYFAEAGANVVINFRNKAPRAEKLAAQLRELGVEALVVGADLTDPESVKAMFDEVERTFGGLDILVLNAAYQKNREGFETIPTEEFDRVFRTNIYSMMWIGREALPHLAPGSSIISTTSIQAFNPSPGLIDYAMTKAAQVAYTKALAEELGPKGIRVNAVAPGPIWTPLIPATSWPDKLTSFGQDTPLGRAGQPAELASAYVLLASADASYISGAILPVTGGKGL